MLNTHTLIEKHFNHLIWELRKKAASPQNNHIFGNQKSDTLYVSYKNNAHLHANQVCPFNSCPVPVQWTKLQALLFSHIV